MKYNFIEHANPERDPNIDLNFDNDILYKELNGSLYAKNNKNNKNINLSVPSNDKTNLTSGKMNSQKKPIKSDSSNITEQIKSNSSYSGSNIYIYFVLVVVCLIVIWYFYGSSRNVKETNIIDTYPNQPELTMMSPDMGMDTRFGRL